MYNSPSHPLFVYDADDAVKTITWKQAGQAIHSVARRLSSVPSLQNAKDTPVVGIFAVTGNNAAIIDAGNRVLIILHRSVILFCHHGGNNARRLPRFPHFTA
jgi:hypothetical protein